MTDPFHLSFDINLFIHCSNQSILYHSFTALAEHSVKILP